MTSVYYLFASPVETAVGNSGTAFYRVEGESVARSLCTLFTRQYSDANGRPSFHHKAITSMSIEEQVLMDELLDSLGLYDDPDPGIYDLQPSKEILLLAEYALRAGKWEVLLREKTETNDGNLVPESGTLPGSGSPATSVIPKMPPEDRRNSGLILLMLLAQAYYKMLECTISSSCGGLDIELNQSYFWIVTSITNLLENHDDLKDFPTRFAPIFSDLYPSTIRDVDWDDMVAPDAERFLSTVQQYVHSKGMHDPEEGSHAWVFVELYRPSVNTAIERAIAYHKRMRQYLQVTNR